MEPHAVLIVDATGRVERANQTGRALLGEVVGRACRDVVRVRDPLRGSGCSATCARQLAASNDQTSSSVGPVAARPHRVSCAGVGGVVVVTLMPTGDLPPATSCLTPRELEVLGLVAEGLSSARIARRLRIGASTVRTHVEHIRDKLDARTRAEAVARAGALGLIR